MPRGRKTVVVVDGIYQRGNSPFWYVSFTDATGKRTRRSTGTTSRAEAQRLLAHWREEARNQVIWNVEPDRTFEELMIGYLKESRDAKAPSSVERDRYSTTALRSFWAGRVLSQINARDVRAYIAERREAGRSSGTINRELGLLSAALNHARTEWEWTIPNPVSGRKPKEPDGRVRWLRPEEAQRLVTVARGRLRAPCLADFIVLALHTGCRSGESLGLEWSRVDFQSGLITLEAQHTKTKRRRSIPLNANARRVLSSRLAWRDANAPGCPWVFCNRQGKRVASVKRAFGAALKKAGIENFRIHDLRHTCAAWLVSAGVPLTEVRDLLGHASVVMTERYAHLAPGRVRVAVDRLVGIDEAGE